MTTRTRVTSSHWGAFNVTVEDGRMVSTAPFDGDLDPSGIDHIIPKAVYHKSRVARPSIRKGWMQNADRARERRGEDEFVELPWDEALDIASEELQRILREHGNEAIFGGSYGWSSAGRFHHAQGQVHRFLNSIGGYVSSFASYSTAAAQAIIPHVWGMKFMDYQLMYQNEWPTIATHTETLVMFGGINPKNSKVSMGGVTRHETGPWFEKFEEKGMRRVNISPQASDSPGDAEWWPIIPGTDTALMLALAWVLEQESLVDRDFLELCTEGYAAFRHYLLGLDDGVEKSPAWASAICGVDERDIVQLARDMAASRTLITVAWSLQRAENGEQPFWMATVLAAMLGQIGLPGGGVGYGYGAIGAIGVSIHPINGMTLPQGENAVKTFIPVARIADMLLNPGTEYHFNGRRMTYPDIRLVYWCGGNPFHHHQDLARLREAFRAPDTIIVNEPWWTATAKHADIVFPATTPYEREDIGRALGDSYLFHMPGLIEPVNDALNDYDIFSGLAGRLGAAERFTEGRSDSEWIEFLYADFVARCEKQGFYVPPLDELKDKNWVELRTRRQGRPEDPLKAFRENPAQNPLGTPSGRIEIFSSVIDGFGYPGVAGHPSWMPPSEWLGAERTKDFPLHLVSPQPGDKLHSQLECALADEPGARPVPVCIHPHDAAERSIKSGDLVCLLNDRGKAMARAKITERIRQGVVAMPTGAWYQPGSDGIDRDGNPNVLTRDMGTSLIGQGSSAHTTLVELEKAAG